jgi:predicted nucleic acid-binding protein
MIVVDASLAVKWFLTESDSGVAQQLFVDFFERMAAPDLIVIEVASSLVRHANSNRVDASLMDAALDDWAAMLIETVIRLDRGTPEKIRDAGRLAMTLGHPLKDCLYLALAIKIGCDFVTCDARFASKAALVYPRTMLLHQFKTT